jgi:hypothetical protein
VLSSQLFSLADRDGQRSHIVGWDQPTAIRREYFRYATPTVSHDRGTAGKRLGDDQPVGLVPLRGHKCHCRRPYRVNKIVSHQMTEVSNRAAEVWFNSLSEIRMVTDRPG